ncbi:MAG: gliding motility-associated C-terminal domain-containing protein [Chitinophagaceae bacterium]|nr:gliding motility-associated C-terminal domain-containing protein [Chitinophagaceae bacterium]MCW5928382.1 gliding motility-associated C-terminal domain-containing protein [Chitinophagaceae bacterium]
MKQSILLPALLLTVLFGKAQLNCTERLFPGDSIIICADTLHRLQLPDIHGPVSYVWEGGQTTGYIDIHQTDTYKVSVSDGSCTVEDSVYVIFNSLIQLPPVENELLCLNTSARRLQAWGESLRWYSTPLSTDGSTTAPIPSTADTGTTYYYVSQTILGCESPRARLTVEVIDKPNFNLGKDIIIPCGAPGVVLQIVEQKYTTYAWQDGSTRPDFTATEAGKYVLRGDNICGSLVDTVTTVTCDTRCVNFPTAFTPNGDGINETFRAGAFCPISTYHLAVFNRFGQKVFETSDPAKAWDGKVNGKRADIGSYTYFCVYYDFMLKRELTLRGQVTLLR